MLSLAQFNCPQLGSFSWEFHEIQSILQLGVYEIYLALVSPVAKTDAISLKLHITPEWLFSSLKERLMIIVENVERHRENMCPF